MDTVTRTHTNAIKLRRAINDAIIAGNAFAEVRRATWSTRNRWAPHLESMYQASRDLDAAFRDARWHVYDLIDPDSRPGAGGNYNPDLYAHICRADSLIDRAVNL